ncbi:MAG: glycosyltransferase [Acidobacteria bacterium]|nr:glycosyltransferase [Acidobacteriota bacterium]
MMSAAPLVSIVIPVLRDSVELEGLLGNLDDAATPDAGDSPEVIVVNSEPADPAIAALQRRFPAVRWMDGARGRGRQMNAGAAVAGGRWLLFLHADARLEPGCLRAVAGLDREDVVGGAFRLAIASPHWFARTIERGVALRTKWLRLPYGDQGIFVRREAFDALGGYAPLPLMEDVDLILRLWRVGRLRFPPERVRVSARRWKRDGWLPRTISNLWLLVRYVAGASPARLARAYYGEDRVRVATESAGSGGGAATSGAVSVIIPALNEEAAIPEVLDEIPEIADRVIVADNGSTDETAELARAAGATVVSEPVRGYGRACLAGLRALPPAGGDDIVVFLDADRSDYPEEMPLLVEPIRRGEADFVLGNRAGAGRPWSARFGTALCVWLINRLWGTRYRDLGPFRAIRRDALDDLGMKDLTWGWTIEMQVKAAEAALRVREVPVRQRTRIGQSKISGTVMGTLRAGARMLHIIWSLHRTRRARRGWPEGGGGAESRSAS